MKRLIAIALTLFATPALAQSPGASSATRASQAAALAAAPMSDTRDEGFARRGYLGTRDDPRIVSADGRLVWDLSALNFLKGDAPPTVNPSLWRHAKLMGLHGLFQVSDRIWQVRGFDIWPTSPSSRATPAGSSSIALTSDRNRQGGALSWSTEKLGARPRDGGDLHPQPHVDHFGGARGLIIDQKPTSSSGQGGR